MSEQTGALAGMSDTMIVVDVAAHCTLDRPVKALLELAGRHEMSLQAVVAAAVAEDERVATKIAEAITGAVTLYVANHWEAKA